MFRITSEPLVPVVMHCAGAGGFVSFEGKIRDHHQGREVLALEYEAPQDLAEAEGRQLLLEAAERFGLLSVEAIHRVGRLEIGETAVWIGVAAAHRREAFEACEWILDALKRRVPIWKKEHYADGDSGWVGADAAPSAAPVNEASFYGRQIRLEEVGDVGQQHLRDARVLVVGVGGLGCAALPYLAAAGVGTIGVCDFDRVDATNLHRQTLFGAADVGKPKAELAATRIARQNPFIEANAHVCRLTPSNAEALLKGYDLVLDCTDNFRTKFLLNDLAVRHAKPLVQASIHRFEGQIHLYDPSSNAGCLSCLWPEAPTDGCVGTCAEIGVLGVVPGVFGALQANEAIKYLLGFPDILSRSLLLMDLQTYAVHHLDRPRNPECPVCGCGGHTRLSLEVDMSELSKEESLNLVILDVRELDEERPRLDFGVDDWRHFPLSKFEEGIEGLNPNRSYLTVCKSGLRSYRAVEMLRERGFTNVRSLAGGVEGNCQLASTPPHTSSRTSSSETAGRRGHG
ncbi:MAG: ThiF family adenylyltransferase [Fimbriimonadaceae bacterium]|nr:ThiF family adenylyltransferase [Fimbriimonadaceae bacterium]